MGTIITILVIIILIVFLSNLFKKPTKPINKSTYQNQKNKKSPKPFKEGFLSFPLKGWNHYQKNYDIDPYFFIGSAKLDYNEYDYYSIAIYTENKLIGYLPKSNNHNLHKFIEREYSGTILCYGFYDYNRTNVTIPAFENKEIIKSIKDFYSKKETLNQFINTDNKTDNDYFNILNLDSQIQSLLKIIPADFEHNYRFIKKYINEFSIILNKNKDFENLIKLKEYKNLIDHLSIKDQESIYKKIENAENQKIKNPFTN